MTITYVFEDALYVNMTNQCPNRCDFCIRNEGDGYYSEGSLWLEHEPSYEEIRLDIMTRDFSLYREVVFCGFGEPTCRLDDMLKICDEIKKESNIPIRLNTNGQANLIWKKDVTPFFKGRVDIMSISLNAADAKSYDNVCHSEYGEAAFPAILEFARKVKPYVKTVVMSMVRGSTVPDSEIEKCRAIADEIGVELRVRDKV